MPSRSLDDALNAIRNEHIRGKACVGKKFEAELSESEKVLLRKSRHFADPITGYSDAELEALLTACGNDPTRLVSMLSESCSRFRRKNVKPFNVW